MSEENKIDVPIITRLDGTGLQQTQAGLQQTGTAAQGVKGDLEKLGFSAEKLKEQLLGMMAAAAIFQQFKEGAKEVMDLEQSFNELDRAALRFNQNGAVVREGIDSFAKKLAETAGIADHVSIPALVKLYSATGDLELAQKRAALAADIAVARHIEFGDALKVVTMAAGGNVRSLREVGIFMQTSGDKTKDANLALGELVKRFGGAADGAKGLAIEVNRLSAQWEDMRAKAVEPLLHLLVTLVQVGKTGFNLLAEGALKLATTFGYVWEQGGNVGKLMQDLFKGNFSKIDEDLARFKSSYRNYQKDYKDITVASEDELLKIWEGSAQKKLGIDRNQKASKILDAREDKQRADESAKLLEEIAKKLAESEVKAEQTSVGKRIALAKEYELEMKQMLARLEKAGLLTEENKTKVIKTAFNKTAGLWLQGAKEEEKIAKDKFDALMKYEDEHEKWLEKLRQKRIEEEKTDAERTKELTQMQMQMAGDAASKLVAAGELAFGANKEFSIAAALISTYQGVAGALAQTGTLGWAAYALAAANLVYGMAQVANISSTNPGSSAGAASGGNSAKAGGFDDPSNDQAARIGGRRWAADMIGEWSKGMSQGWNEGMGAHGAGSSSTVNNNMQRTYHLHGLSFMDPNNVQQVKMLSRALAIEDRQVERARIIARTAK